MENAALAPYTSDTVVGIRLARHEEAVSRSAIIGAASDLVALWKAQKVASLPRADRNAAIEETRERLIRAVEAYDDRLEQSGAATTKAA